MCETCRHCPVVLMVDGLNRPIEHISSIEHIEHEDAIHLEMFGRTPVPPQWQFRLIVFAVVTENVLKRATLVPQIHVYQHDRWSRVWRRLVEYLHEQWQATEPIVCVCVCCHIWDNSQLRQSLNRRLVRTRLSNVKWCSLVCLIDGTLGPASQWYAISPINHGQWWSSTCSISFEWHRKAS